MGDTPATSTVRNALAVTAAVDDLLRPGREGRLLDADTAVDAVVAIIEESGGLRPHQVRDVIDHLQNRCADGALSPPSQGISPPLMQGLTLHYDASALPRFPSDSTRTGGVGEPPGDGEGIQDDASDQDPWATEDTDLTDDVDDMPNTGMDPLAEGKPERATAAVDELAARVNQGAGP